MCAALCELQWCGDVAFRGIRSEDDNLGAVLRVYGPRGA